MRLEDVEAEKARPSEAIVVGAVGPIDPGSEVGVKGLAASGDGVGIDAGGEMSSLWVPADPVIEVVGRVIAEVEKWAAHG